MRACSCWRGFIGGRYAWCATALLTLSGSAFAQSNGVEELAYPDSAVHPSANWSDEAAAESAEPSVVEPTADDFCSCDDPCACQYDCGNGGLCCLGSLIQPSDPCYDDFISPMTNPVFFEDPRNLTEARLIFLNHKVPQTAAGGDIQLYALQVRAALTDRLSLIATKDGYIVSDNPLISDGWADVSAGLKYLLYSDPANQVLASAGAVYEMPVGSHRSEQGLGDGIFDLFLTGGAQICDSGHWIGAGGFVLPTDDNRNSTWCYVSNHFDYEFYNRLYSLIEVNWYHWLESGDYGYAGIEGTDLYNFGSTGVAGNNIVTGAFGMKFKPSRSQEIGVCWELPLTGRRDVLENRLTFDWILRF